jgi:hypothetical protein
MANPFSGLENIGQSYLQGVQLAQQRQAREEALAQRQEEARIRQDYYNQLGQERQDALRERIKARLDAASGQFGQDLVLDAQGEPDYAKSALKRDQRLQTQQLRTALGARAGEFNINEPLAPEIIESPEYKLAYNQGMARQLQRTSAYENALARRGLIKLPGAVEDQIANRPTTAGILQGQQDLSQYPQTTIGGNRYAYVGPSPRASTVKGPKIIIEEGPEGRKRKFEGTPEEARAYEASLLATPEKEPGVFDDIDAALKELQKLKAKRVDDVNVYQDDAGNLKVRKDVSGFMGESSGISPEEAARQLEGERARRREIYGMPAEAKPKNRAEAAAQRVKRFTLSQVMEGALPRAAAPMAAPMAAPEIPQAAPSGPIQFTPEEWDAILSQPDGENTQEF